MEPIIAPSTFYWIEVIGNAKTCSTIFFGVGIAVLIVLLFFSLYCWQRTTLKVISEKYSRKRV